MATQKIFDRIPIYPRYEYIKNIVVRTLLSQASDRIPISLGDIASSCNDLELRSYKWYMENMNVTLDYIINKIAKSVEGSLIELSDDKGNIEYLLLYNNEKMIGRQRFTIAHELGHYFLGHHNMIDDSVISRGGFNSSEYKILEKEANYFARLLLVPLPLVTFMAKNWGVIKRYHLEKIFNVTFSVAGNVISHLKKQQKRGHSPTNKEVINKFVDNLYEYIGIHVCSICRSEYVPLNEFTYCPICGSSGMTRIMSEDYEIYNDFERGDYMIYEGIEVDKDSKAVVCPICDNEEPEYGGHCSICGQLLINKCTNTEYPGRSAYDDAPCGALLPGNARYCTYCGAESTFLREGLLKPWGKVITQNVNESTNHYSKPHLIEDIPF